MTLDIDAATTCTPSQLGVFTWRYLNPGFTIELIEAIKNHRASGHVDAKSECFGCKDHLDQLAQEQFFNDFFEGWQHAGVVGCYSPLETI